MREPIAVAQSVANEVDGDLNVDVNSATPTDEKGLDRSGPRMALTDLDDAAATRLTPWLNDNHIPKMPYHVRSRLAGIDVKELWRRLNRSYESQSKDKTCTSDQRSATTDLIVSLFPDIEYRFAICKYRLTGHGGTHARGPILDSSHPNSRVYFEHYWQSDFLARFVAKDKIYIIKKTPEDGYFVVTEIDAKEAGANFRID